MTLRKLTLIGLTVALIMITPMSLMAQGNGNGNGGNGNGGGGILAEILPPPGYLKLTDEQKDSVRGLAEGLRTNLMPIREDQRALEQELRDALNADSPDATSVGQLTLDVRALAQQSRGEITAFGADFREILDDEQQVKWDHHTELRRLGRR